jgi:hypothetical protein
MKGGGLGAAAAMKRRRAGCIGKSRGNAGIGAGTGINLVKIVKLSILPLLKIAIYCIPLSGGIVQHKSALIIYTTNHSNIEGKLVDIIIDPQIMNECISTKSHGGER